MTFAQVLAPAIELAEKGFPLSDALAREIHSAKKLREYPTSIKLFHLDQHEPQAGEIWRNLESGRHCSASWWRRKRKPPGGTFRRSARRARPLLQGRYRPRHGGFYRKKRRPLPL